MKKIFLLFVALGFLVSMLPMRSANAGFVYTFKSINDGLYGADITCIEIDANYQNTIYLGTSNEGVFVSSDLEKNWKWIGKGLEFISPGFVPTYLKINTIKTVKGKLGVIYVGTSAGLFISSDGGLSYTSIGNLSKQVYSIYVDKHNSNKIIVGTDNGIYRSFDGGNTFEEANKAITKTYVYYIIEDYSMEGSFYIVTDKGIYKSIDDCNNWLLVGTGIGGKISYMVQNPKKPEIIYAGSSFGIYITYDYGDHWANLIKDNMKYSVNFIAIDSFDDRNLIAVTSSGILKSSDYGNNWNWILNVPQQVRVSCAAVIGNDFSTVYLGSNFGFIIFRNGSFAFSNTGLGLLNISAVGFDPNYKTLYAETSLGLYKKGYGDSSWSYLSGSLYGANPHAFAVDPKVPNSMFAATKYGIMRSTDNGTSWTQTSLPQEEFFSVAFSMANSNSLYAITSNSLYFSKNSGTNWIVYSFSNVGSFLSVVAPSDGNVYILTPSSIIKSSDLKNWTIISEVSSFKPLTLTCDFYQADTFYLGTTDGIYVSRDGMKNWYVLSDLPPNTSVYSVISINDSNNTLYLGTNNGVFKSVLREDDNPPTIKIFSPQDNSTVNKPSLTITGNVSDLESGIANLSINGIDVPFSSQGDFSFDIVLSPGVNTILVQATDKASNTSRKSITLNYIKSVVLVLYIGDKTMTSSNGSLVTLDSPPVIVEGRTLVPIRPIIEELGGTISWDDFEKKVTISIGNNTVELWIDNPQARVNGTVKWIDDTNHKVVPKIISGRTMLPLRFVAESIGAKVDWDGTLKKITITYPAL